MARITRDIKALTKNTLGLTLDIATAALTVASGTATLAREVVQGTNKDNLQNLVTYTTDVVTGNEIGTANTKLDTAIANGQFGKEIAEFCLEAIHGNKEYREEARKIEEKIATAENELDALLLQAELAQLEVDATKEIAKLNKAVEAAKSDA